MRDRLYETRQMIEPQPEPTWKPVPRPGTRGVAFRVLLRKDGLLLANLRFETAAAIDPHSAPHEIDVICVSGSGFTSIADRVYPIRAGQTVRWPANAEHGLWTDREAMETIMLERYRI